MDFINNISDSPNDVFDSDYYMNGPSSGKSNYEGYSWLPDQTIPMAQMMMRALDISLCDTVLDYGTARGYLVKAFRLLGVNATGYDISKWAIENCDPEVKEFVSNSLETEPMSYDFIVAKDCFEHISQPDLEALLPRLYKAVRKSMLVIVPLSHNEDGPYLCPKDEKDSTHLIRWPLQTWINFLQSIDRRMVVSGSYYVPGIKQANTAWENSCGFLIVRRF